MKSSSCTLDKVLAFVYYIPVYVRTLISLYLCILCDQLSLLLLPSVDDFEEHLLENLSEDLNVEVVLCMVCVLQVVNNLLFAVGFWCG